MHIFIDETGSFAGVGDFPSLSMVGGLVVPDSRLASLEKKYRKLRPALLVDKDEVKGRKLDEAQVEAVVSLLLEHSVLFEASAVDLGMHTEAELRAYHAAQADGMTCNLTSEHQQPFVEQVWKFRRQFEAFKLPLFVQSQLTFQLLPVIFEHATLYYCTRRPEELANFHWVIDAKGKDVGTPTEWETWWSKWVLPEMQNHSFNNAFGAIKIGDYSHMSRFLIGEPSEFVKQQAGWKEGDPPAFDIGKIFRDSFTFSPDSIPGLEMVDIITNATRRALVGNLKPQGWKRIPQLMIHTNKPHYVQFVAFGLAKGPKTVSHPYAGNLKQFGKNGRNMLPPSAYKKKKW